MQPHRLQRRLKIIAPDAQDWVWALARHSPRDFGYASDEWSRTLLVFHVRRYCREAGHSSLAGVTYAGLSHLLAVGSNVEA